MKTLDGDSDKDTESDENVMTVETDGENKYKKKIMGRFSIKGQKIQMQNDCGSTVNILPKKCVLDNVPIEQSPRQLYLYGSGASIVAEGTCKVLMKKPKNNRKYEDLNLL